jgi:O-antigen/teichoic acid export membrane protein
MKNLKQKAIWGVFLGIGERVFSQSVLFFSQIIMMRILSAKEYGQIGILIIFISVSMLLIDSGFGNALIQKRTVTGEDYSTAFWLNNIISSFCYMAIFLSAPLISSFYSDPELILLVRVLGINLFLTAVGMVPQTILIKEMKFKSLARISVWSYVVSGLVGVLCAYQGAGVWSIVWQILSLQLCRSLFAIWDANWLPLMKLNKSSFASLIQFGNKMLISNLLDHIFLNLHVSLVGKYHNAQVGFFSQANKFCLLFFGLFSAPIHTISMTIMSASEDKSEEKRRLFKNFIQMSAFFTFPVVLGVIAIAEPAIKLIFGEKWIPIVPLFMWLCASGLLSTIYVINQNVLKSNNRTDLLLASNIIRKIFLLISILIGIHWGIKGILIAYFCSSIADFFINGFFTCQLIGVSIKTQFSYIWRTLFNSVLMFGIVMSSNNLPVENEILNIGLKSLIGITVYLTGAFLLCKENIAEALTVSSILLSKFFNQSAIVEVK